MFLFNRLTPKISLFISILSLVVGTGLALGKDIQLWYIPLTLSVPTILIFLFTIQRRRPIQSRSDGFLNQDKAFQMLSEAVSLEPLTNPFCWHLTIMHANGTAVAARVAETMLSTTQLLREIILKRIGNMQAEHLNTADKIKFHLGRIRRVEAIIAGVVTKDNTATKSYCLIHEGEKVCNLLSEGRDLFDEIVNNMDDFSNKIPPDISKELEEFYLLSFDDSKLSQDARKWKHSISILMKQDIPAKLVKIIENNLIDAEKLAKIVLDKLRQDWFNHLKFVWNDPICRVTYNNRQVS